MLQHIFLDYLILKRTSSITITWRSCSHTHWAWRKSFCSSWVVQLNLWGFCTSVTGKLGSPRPINNWDLLPYASALHIVILACARSTKSLLEWIQREFQSNPEVHHTICPSHAYYCLGFSPSPPIDLTFITPAEWVPSLLPFLLTRAKGLLIFFVKPGVICENIWTSIFRHYKGSSDYAWWAPSISQLLICGRHDARCRTHNWNAPSFFHNTCSGFAHSWILDGLLLNEWPTAFPLAPLLLMSLIGVTGMDLYFCILYDTLLEAFSSFLHDLHPCPQLLQDVMII